MDIIKSGLMDHWTWMLYIKSFNIDITSNIYNTNMLSNESSELSLNDIQILMRKIVVLYCVAVLIFVCELLIYICREYIILQSVVNVNIKLNVKL